MIRENPTVVPASVLDREVKRGYSAEEVLAAFKRQRAEISTAQEVSGRLAQFKRVLFATRPLSAYLAEIRQEGPAINTDNTSESGASKAHAGTSGELPEDSAAAGGTHTSEKGVVDDNPFDLGPMNSLPSFARLQKLVHADKLDSVFTHMPGLLVAAFSADSVARKGGAINSKWSPRATPLEELGSRARKYKFIGIGADNTVHTSEQEIVIGSPEDFVMNLGNFLRSNGTVLPAVSWQQAIETEYADAYKIHTDGPPETPEQLAQRATLEKFGMVHADIKAFFVAVTKNEHTRTAADTALLQRGYIVLGKSTLKPDELTALQGAVDDALLTQRQFDAFMLLRSGEKKLSFFNFRDADTIGKAANFIYKLAPLSEKIRTVNTEAILFGKDGAWLEKYRKAISMKALGKSRVDEKILKEGEGFVRVAPVLAGWYETQAPGCAPVLRTAINVGQISIDDVVKFANGKSGVLNKRKNRIEAVLTKFKKDTEARVAETARANESADRFADTFFPVAQLPAGNVFRNAERRRENARILKNVFETQGGERVVMERLATADETVNGYATTFGQSLGSSHGNTTLQLWRVAELAKSSRGDTATLEAIAIAFENISIGSHITTKYKNDPGAVRNIIALLASNNRTPAGVAAVTAVRRYLEAGEFSKPGMLGKNIKIAFTTLG